MATSAEGREFLHAVRNDDVDAAKLILRLHGEQLLHPAGSGGAALRAAAKRGSTLMVAFLLSAGIPADVEDTDGRSAAEIARAAGHAQVADILDACRPSPGDARNGAGRAERSRSLAADGVHDEFVGRSPAAYTRSLPTERSYARTPPPSTRPFHVAASPARQVALSARSASRGGGASARGLTPIDAYRSQQRHRQVQRERLVAHTQRAMESELTRLREATAEFRRLREAVGGTSGGGGSRPRPRLSSTPSSARRERAQTYTPPGSASASYAEPRAGDFSETSADAAAVRRGRSSSTNVAEEVRALRAQSERLLHERRKLADGGLSTAYAPPPPPSEGETARRAEVPPGARAGDFSETSGEATLPAGSHPPAGLPAPRPAPGAARAGAGGGMQISLELAASAAAASASAAMAAAAVRGEQPSAAALAPPPPPPPRPDSQGGAPASAATQSGGAAQPPAKRERPYSARPQSRAARLAAALAASDAAGTPPQQHGGAGADGGARGQAAAAEALAAASEARTAAAQAGVLPSMSGRPAAAADAPMVVPAAALEPWHSPVDRRPSADARAAAQATEPHAPHAQLSAAAVAGARAAGVDGAADGDAPQVDDEDLAAGGGAAAADDEYQALFDSTADEDELLDSHDDSTSISLSAESASYDGGGGGGGAAAVAAGGGRGAATQSPPPPPPRADAPDAGLGVTTATTRPASISRATAASGSLREASASASAAAASARHALRAGGGNGGNGVSADLPTKLGGGGGAYAEGAEEGDGFEEEEEEEEEEGDGAAALDAVMRQRQTRAAADGAAAAPTNGVLSLGAHRAREYAAGVGAGGAAAAYGLADAGEHGAAADADADAEDGLAEASDGALTLGLPQLLSAVGGGARAGAAQPSGAEPAGGRQGARKRRAEGSEMQSRAELTDSAASVARTGCGMVPPAAAAAGAGGAQSDVAMRDTQRDDAAAAAAAAAAATAAPDEEEEDESAASESAAAAPPPPADPLASLELKPAQRVLLESCRVLEGSAEPIVSVCFAPERGSLREIASPAEIESGQLYPRTLCLRADWPRPATAAAGAVAAVAGAAPAPTPPQLMLVHGANADGADGGAVRIGRGADCALRLADERVSSTHFAVVPRRAAAVGGGAGADGSLCRWAIRDEGSSNGSVLCLQGAEAPAAPLCAGDQLILGSSRLMVSFIMQADEAGEGGGEEGGGGLDAAGSLGSRLLVLSLLPTDEWSAMQWRLDAARTPVVTVGRAAHNSVVLPDRSVSSEHALLVFDSANPNPNPNPNHPNPNAANAAASAASAANAAARGSAAWPRRALGWWARDRGSSNGTYLRLSVPKSASRPFALTPGHRLCAGSCTISVSRFACGVASACGRRPTMEDAHCIVDNLPLSALDGAAGGAPDAPPAAGVLNGPPAAAGAAGVSTVVDDGWRASLFGVYDGHSGSKAAHFLRARLAAAVSAQLRARAAAPAQAAAGASAPLVASLDLSSARAALERAFAMTDDELLSRGAEGDAGSCAAVALVSEGHVLTAHVGDCRVVLWRHGVAVPLTSDHRAGAPVERARVERAGGFVAYGRVLGQLAVSRSFGDRAFKDLDVSGGVGGTPRMSRLVSAEPDVSCVRWQKGDYLLLACDGVWDVMTDQEATDALVEAHMATGNMQLAVEQLVHSVEHDRKSNDNITAIGVRLDD